MLRYQQLGTPKYASSIIIILIIVYWLFKDIFWIIKFVDLVNKLNI